MFLFVIAHQVIFVISIIRNNILYQFLLHMARHLKITQMFPDISYTIVT